MPATVKLNSSLRGLARSYREKVARVVNESAQEVASIASQLAPRESGHLADDSISIKQTGSTDVVRVVVDTRDGDHPYNYGPDVEYGDADSPAQPYLRPAAEIVRPRMERRLRSLRP